jgi:hypothetical protein
LGPGKDRDRRLSDDAPAPGKRARMESYYEGSSGGSYQPGAASAGKAHGGMPGRTRATGFEQSGYFTAETTSAIADMLKSGNADKAMQAMTMVMDACLNDPEGQQAVNNHGLLSIVVPFLEAWEKPQLQLRAALCTAACTSSSVVNRIGMVKHGAVAIFVRMLSSGQENHQEAACNNIMNLVKRPSEVEQSYIDNALGDSATRDYHVTAQGEVNRFGGVEKLCQLMERGQLRVRSAAAAAVANAMTTSHPSRVAFQGANGVARCLSMMRQCDEIGTVRPPLTQERGSGSVCHGLV